MNAVRWGSIDFTSRDSVLAAARNFEDTDVAAYNDAVSASMFSSWTQVPVAHGPDIRGYLRRRRIRDSSGVTHHSSARNAARYHCVYSVELASFRILPRVGLQCRSYRSALQLLAVARCATTLPVEDFPPRSDHGGGDGRCIETGSPAERKSMMNARTDAGKGGS